MPIFHAPHTPFNAGAAFENFYSLSKHHAEEGGDCCSRLVFHVGGGVCIVCLHLKINATAATTLHLLSALTAAKGFTWGGGSYCSIVVFGHTPAKSHLLKFKMIVVTSM